MAQFRAYIVVFAVKKGIIRKNPRRKRKTILGVLANKRMSREAGGAYQL